MSDYLALAFDLRRLIDKARLEIAWCRRCCTKCLKNEGSAVSLCCDALTWSLDPSAGNPIIPPVGTSMTEGHLEDCPRRVGAHVEISAAGDQQRTFMCKDCGATWNEPHPPWKGE